jgi:hypothetical protein
MKYRMAELIVPAIVKPQTHIIAATPLPRTIEEHIWIWVIMPGNLLIPEGTAEQ